MMKIIITRITIKLNRKNKKLTKIKKAVKDEEAIKRKIIQITLKTKLKIIFKQKMWEILKITQDNR